MVMGCDKLSRDNLSHVQSEIFVVRSSRRNKNGFALTHVEPLWRRSAMAWDDEEDTTTYLVVINHEE